MNMTVRLFSMAMVFMVVLSACNLPSDQAPTADPNIVFTAAAQTVEAQLTQSAPLATPTLPLPPTVAPTQLLPPTVSVPTLPPPTSTQECDKAQFVADVTVPDGTQMDPNQAFAKTWRLKNVGSCTWTTAYALVFNNGEAMGGPASQALAGSVAPGQIVDISVNLKAPSSPGDYTGWWKIRNAAGVLFASVYVQIKVKGSAAFAVTSVNMSASGSCGAFTITAAITTNGPGTVTYNWVRSDHSTDTVTHPPLVFDTAGTKSVTATWATSSSGAKWMDIDIDEPNNQQFGRANFSCP